MKELITKNQTSSKDDHLSLEQNVHQKTQTFIASPIPIGQVDEKVELTSEITQSLMEPTEKGFAPGIQVIE